MSKDIPCLMIFYYVSSSEWINKGKHQMMFSDENVFRLFYYPISLAATEGTCSRLSCSSWNISESFMSGLVTLSIHWNLLISSFCSSTLGLDGYRCFYMLSHTFYIIHIVVYIIHESRSYQGKEKKWNIMAFLLLCIFSYRNCINVVILIMASYIFDIP